MRAILRYRLRTVIAAMTLLAIVLSIYLDSIGTHATDVGVIISIRGAPLETNLPMRLCPSPSPYRIEHGVAFFESCGPEILRGRADARYSCRVTRIVLRGPSYNDSSLERLGELDFLRELQLVNTRVTASAIARLTRQLPHLKVTVPRFARRRLTLHLRLPDGLPVRIRTNHSNWPFDRTVNKGVRPSTEVTEL